MPPTPAATATAVLYQVASGQAVGCGDSGVPPPPPAQSITLTALGGLSATAGGSSLGFSAAVTNPVALPLSFVTEAASGPTPTGGSSTWSTGDLNKAISLTWAAAGTSVIRVRDANDALSNSLSVVVAAAPTPSPPPPAPSSPPIPNKTRLSNPTLFADVAATTALSGGSTGGNIVTAARGSVAAPTLDFVWGIYGPSAAYVDTQSKWAWRNSGGDWIDDNGTWQGTAAPHFTFAANSVTSGSATYSSIAATGAAKAAFWRGKWNSFIVKCVGGSRSIAALHHPTLAAPAMQVTYTDATTATLACLACVRLTTGSAYTQIGAEEAAISQSVALEFAMPTKEVASATISLVISSHNATAATVSGYIVNPPTNYVEEDEGLARNYPWDVGISANPNVLFSQQFLTTTLSDYVITSPPSVDVFNSANWSPSVIGLSGTVDDTKLPTAFSGVAVSGSNKWIYKQNTSTISVVAPSYSSDGFTAPPSGHGALRVVIPGSAVADGGIVGYDGSLGADLWALFDKARSGLVDHFTVRFMYRYHYSGGVPNISDVKMFRSAGGATAYYAVPTGKWGIGGQHWTTTGGNNNVGGGNLGWSARLGNTDAPADLSVAPRSVYAHVQDMIPGVNFEAGKDGGMGAALYPDTWYCIEIDTTLNTYNETTGVAGADGVMAIYVNGRLDATHTGWKFREGVIPAQSATELKPFRRLGAIGLCLNDYHGGVRPPDRDLINFYSNIVVTDGPRIGQPAPALPSWVPAAGGVTEMTVANGLLTNSFRSTAATYYNDYYLAGTADNYNGSVVNPNYGVYGALVFEGGGHSYSNNNSSVQLDLAYGSATFRRLNNPTPLFGTGTDTTTKDNNDTANILATLINFADLTYTTDGQPASSHSYGDQVVIPHHQAGGAPFGSFHKFLREGPGRTYNANGAEAPFKMDFDTIGASNYAYEKAGVVRFSGSNLNVTGGPNWSVHVPAQNRVYVEAHNGNQPVRWFDLMLRKYINGTGAQMNGTGQGNGGQMLYVPSRNLILLANRSAGVLAIRYMDVSSLDPSWVNTPRTLSAPITVSDDWSEIALCPTTGKLLVGNTAAGGTVVYEITIPASLSSTWTVASTTISAGGSISYRAPGIGLGYGRWAVNPKTRTINYLVKAAYDNSQTAQEILYAYRPLGT